MSSWWTGISAAQTNLECGGHSHTLRWQRGTLTAVDHGDPAAEATLAALAGQPVPCLDALRAWARRRDDPRVLTLGSRGVTDPLHINTDRQRHPRNRQGRGATELLGLLALGGGLPDRLQANAAATWTRRLRTGHSTLDATLPQLQAALYGRVLSALRVWLGEPDLILELTMVDPTVTPHLARTGDTIAVSLPFAWLTDVWARGLAIIFGRLCLAADTADGTHWTLQTIGTDLHDTAQLAVTFAE